MECEKSFITIKLIWHSYLILSLDNCVHETLAETGLIWGAVMSITKEKSCHVGCCSVKQAQKAVKAGAVQASERRKLNLTNRGNFFFLWKTNRDNSDPDEPGSSYLYFGRWIAIHQTARRRPTTRHVMSTNGPTHEQPAAPAQSACGYRQVRWQVSFYLFF